MRRKVGAPQPHRGSPLTVRPHSHRYREIHSANKLSKLESRFFPRASSEALGTLTLGLDEPLQGLSPLGLQTSGTVGSLLGAVSSCEACRLHCAALMVTMIDGLVSVSRWAAKLNIVVSCL